MTDCFLRQLSIGDIVVLHGISPSIAHSFGIYLGGTNFYVPGDANYEIRTIKQSNYILKMRPDDVPIRGNLILQYRKKMQADMEHQYLKDNYQTGSILSLQSKEREQYLLNLGRYYTSKRSKVWLSLLITNKRGLKSKNQKLYKAFSDFLESVRNNDSTFDLKLQDFYYEKIIELGGNISPLKIHDYPMRLFMTCQRDYILRNKELLTGGKICAKYLDTKLNVIRGNSHLILKRDSRYNGPDEVKILCGEKYNLTD